MDEERRLRHEWAFFDVANARLAEVVDRAPPDNVYAASVRDRFARKLGEVVSREESVYQLPSRVVALAGKDDATQLQGLLDVLKEFNDCFVGHDVRDLHVLLNTHPVAVGLQRDISNWLGRYTKSRAAGSGAPRSGCPVEFFQRLYEDLGPFLNDLARDPNTIHSLVLEEANDFHAWFMAEETWMPFFRFVREDNHSVTVQTRFEDDARKQYCGNLLQLYRWPFAQNFPDFALMLARSPEFTKLALDAPFDKVCGRLRRMADDIQEMRPLLIRNFKPMKTNLRLAQGCWIAFRWGLRHRAGEVEAGVSEQHLLEQYEGNCFQYTMALGGDGLLASSSTPWMTAMAMGFLEIAEEARIFMQATFLAANLMVVEAIHAKLFTFYDAIDIDTLLARLARKSRDGRLDEADEEEFVAATARKLAEQEEPETADPGGRHHVASLRSQRLFRILQEKLGCEVRPGKGSEICVYREGGHIFKLGHHKSNDYVGAGWIRRLLRRVGITMQEWAEALGL